MSLRGRIAAAASVSVALAVLAAAIGVYFAVRADLRDGIDRFLRQRAQDVSTLASHPPAATVALQELTDRFRRAAFPARVQPGPFGGPSGYVQFIAPNGTLVVPGGQSTSSAIPLEAGDLKIARSGHGLSFADRRVRGTDLRMLTEGIGKRGAVILARPLTEINDDLANLLPLLILVAVGGIVLATLLGVLVARTALVPITRFTARAEELSGSLDLSQRLEITGRDELARMAQSFNATLEALERSMEAQRHLVADASHELRTPIASLQANIQILQEAGRLTLAEQASLREDIESELKELTRLVSDVVELARGSKRAAGADFCRLDELVASAIERERRRGEARISWQLEPTLISADTGRVDRAVANLLDNARKWSPTNGVIEVTLAHGVLHVRDHGQGFDERDLPFVFDRFYRADRARNLPGSGLGLAIVRQVAEAHGGYARATNAKDGGAALSVSFGATLQLSSASATN